MRVSQECFHWFSHMFSRLAFHVRRGKQWLPSMPGKFNNSLPSLLNGRRLKYQLERSKVVFLSRTRCCKEKKYRNVEHFSVIGVKVSKTNRKRKMVRDVGVKKKKKAGLNDQIWTPLTSTPSSLLLPPSFLELPR